MSLSPGQVYAHYRLLEHYRGTRKSPRAIALELGVDAVVEGSVLRSGSRARSSSGSPSS